MRSEHRAMSWAEFQRLPAHPGWKHEYWDGAAHIIPRDQCAVVRVGVEPRPVRAVLATRPVTRADEVALASAYSDSFADTVEYCDAEPETIWRSARENVRAFLAGDRGALVSASRLAIDPVVKDPVLAVAGAALLVRTRDGAPMLDVLLVRPAWQRRGLAWAMVCESLGELHRQGEAFLRSRYHLANEPSQAWHRRFGFLEEPDLLLARHHLRSAAHELWRRKEMGALDEEAERRLLLEKQRWERLVERLETIADEQGWEAVSPMIRLY